MVVPFGDLARQYRKYQDEYNAAVQRVMDLGWFVLGSEGLAFEEEFAAYCGAPYCISCNSGTDAIQLALLGHGISRGDGVITAANTCVPTVVGITGSGSEVRLCDVHPETALMDAELLARKLTSHSCKAVIPVHLYGQPADIATISDVAQQNNAIVIEDAAQAHGARYKGEIVGSHGNTVAWSFYPSKNLGAFGDGGAVTTHDAAVADRIRMLRNYGQSRRYYHDLEGVNSRLDEIQAAILRDRLPRLDNENARRRQIAERYRAEISNSAIRFIEQGEQAQSCEHLFSIRCKKRNAVLERLENAGIKCMIHYPIPIHLQKAYIGLGYQRGDFPNSELICDEVLSLPMFPELTDLEVNAVVRAVNAVVA